jgi:hypothetical protein
MLFTVRIVDEFEPNFEVWISSLEHDLSKLSNHDYIGLWCKKL